MGASPDGLIDEDGLVEIKCPFSAKDFTPQEAAEALTQIKGVFNKKNSDTMSRTHRYFYQVQGQLHVSQRQYCIFAMWTPKYMKQIRVDRDDDFWESHMKDFLIRFYHKCMLPEILDSRHKRSMSIRNPEYIKNAMAKAKLEKSSGKPQQVPKTQSNVVEQRQLCKRSFTGTVMVEEDDKCIIVSHEKGEGFAPEDAKVFRQTLDNKTHSLSRIRNNVLPLGSRLDDDSVDEFLQIVRKKYEFENQSVAYMYSHHTLVEPVQSKRSVQLIGGNATDYWRCLSFDGAKLTVYDSLPGCNYDRLVKKEKDYIRLRYPTIRKIDITFQKVQHQPVGVSCGIYTCAFAISVVLGRDPCKKSIPMMRH